MADPITVTYGAAGVQTLDVAALTAGAGNVLGTDGFDSYATSQSGAFTTDYGTGGIITGTYGGAYRILQANLYGGAGGTGNYIATFASTGYQITLATKGVPGVNYFGFWLSALDAGNEVVFRRDGAEVGSYTPSDLLAAVGGKPAYFGNPTANFSGQDGHEPFAFVNFFDTSGFFNEIDVFERSGFGGYESDNHTVGYRAANTTTGGTIIAEPAGVSLFALGLMGLYAARRRLA